MHWTWKIFNISMKVFDISLIIWAIATGSLFFIELQTNEEFHDQWFCEESINSSNTYLGEDSLIEINGKWILQETEPAKQVDNAENCDILRKVKKRLLNFLWYVYLPFLLFSYWYKNKNEKNINHNTLKNKKDGRN